MRRFAAQNGDGGVLIPVDPPQNIGKPGFEPGASCPQGRRSSQAALLPEQPLAFVFYSRRPTGVGTRPAARIAHGARTLSYFPLIVHHSFYQSSAISVNETHFRN